MKQRPGKFHGERDVSSVDHPRNVNMSSTTAYQIKSVPASQAEDKNGLPVIRDKEGLNIEPNGQTHPQGENGSNQHEPDPREEMEELNVGFSNYWVSIMAINQRDEQRSAYLPRAAAYLHLLRQYRRVLVHCGYDNLNGLWGIAPTHEHHLRPVCHTLHHLRQCRAWRLGRLPCRRQYFRATIRVPVHRALPCNVLGHRDSVNRWCPHNACHTQAISEQDSSPGSRTI